MPSIISVGTPAVTAMAAVGPQPLGTGGGCGAGRRMSRIISKVEVNTNAVPVALGAELPSFAGNVDIARRRSIAGKSGHERRKLQLLAVLTKV
jgi:hypothetical protein